MELSADYRPEFESLRDGLVELAQIRCVEPLMERVVGLLAQRPHIALARLWLLDRGDRCEHCAQRKPCPNPAACLHLAASAGCRLDPDGPDWNSTDGDYARIPLGVGKIGRVGATGEAIVVKDFAVSEPTWLERYPWAVREHIRGFNAQPITFKSERLGVLAVFSRIPTPDQGPVWMRILADALARALLTARAFDEIERLRARLEVEQGGFPEEAREARTSGNLIGEHAAMRQLLRQIEMLTQAHLRFLRSYHWPGDVRELQHAVEHALMLCQRGVLQLDMPTAAAPTQTGSGLPLLTERDFRQLERQNTLAALHRSGWKVHGEQGAARLLGVKPTTLISRLKKLGLKRPERGINRGHRPAGT